MRGAFPAAPSNRDPWDVVLTCIVLLALVSVMLIDGWIHSRRAAEVEEIWKRAVSLGYAERYYDDADDRTASYRFKEPQ